MPNQSSESTDLLGSHMVKLIAAFAAVYIIWGSTYLGIRFAVETLPPLLMAGVRFFLAGLILYPIIRHRTKSVITLRHWMNAGIVGTLMLLGGNGLVCWAEQRVDSSVAALLIATIPLWMIGLDWLIFRGPRPTWRMVLGLVIGLGGIYMLIDTAGKNNEPLPAPLAIALLTACAFWSLGSLYARRGVMPKDPFLSSAMQLMTGGLALLIAGSVRGEWAMVDPAGMSMKSLLALVYLIVFGSLIAFSAYVWLLNNCDSAKVSTYAFVNPVVAVVLGAVLANEAFTGRHAIAAVIIIGSTILITRTRAAKPVAPAPKPELRPCESK